MNIWVHKYRLQQNEKEILGALLKFNFSPELTGYACLQTWPTLGDLTIEEHLKHLREGEVDEVLRQVFYFAQSDARARLDKINLNEGLIPPPSHSLITSIKSLNKHSIQDKSLIKIKVGTNIMEELEQLSALEPEFRNKNIKIRLDFNAKINFDNVSEFLEKLKKSWGHLEFIDLIEDPCKSENSNWQKLKNRFGVTLAADREHGAYSQADVIVIKPTIQSADFAIEYALSNDKKVYFTSNLDHGLGIACARYEAAHLFKKYPNLVLPCGLNFTADFEQGCSDGYGYGYSRELQSAKWDFLL